MRWMRVKASWTEVALLLLVTFMLFRPDYFMDHLAPKYESRPPAELLKIAAQMPDKGRLVAVLKGMNMEDDELQKTVAVPLPARPEGSTPTGYADGYTRKSGGWGTGEEERERIG